MTPRILLAREVPVGPVIIGGRHPILRQTMTVAATEDTEVAHAEICRLAEAGAELVRVTVQSVKIAEKLEPLRAALERSGVHVPLAADIHFSAEAALRAADFVEKVRVNPGNFADKRSGDDRLLDDAAYERELERVAERFTPLVEKCKRLGRAMRIGSNHGSLSGRILARYGDTPVGMVNAALEYVHIAESQGYHDIVLSMKASHVGVCVNAYRLLALEMLRRAEADGAPVYPLHLGITEAGEGEDARLKSYIGMGSLLELGIGDTVRVSLTEDSERELPAARALAERYSDRRQRSEAWTAGALADHFFARGSDPETGALPYEEAVIATGSEAMATLHPVVLVPTHWKPAIGDLLSLPWRPLAPDHVLMDGHEGPDAVVLSRGSTVRLCEPKLEAGARERTYLELAVSVGVPLLESRARRIAVKVSSQEEALRGVELAYAILQTTRLRMSRPDFISCPSCGRTHFDLLETTRRVRERFEHIAGVKIAIMGCIVNGPGEMVDADFGYVGSATGKVDLYVGRDRVERNIPSERAVDRMQELLDCYGLWQEPSPSETPGRSGA